MILHNSTYAQLKLLFDPNDILFLSVTGMVFCFLLKVTVMLNFRVAN